jgi:streptomycin 6-kinase
MKINMLIVSDANEIAFCFSDGLKAISPSHIPSFHLEQLPMRFASLFLAAAMALAVTPTAFAQSEESVMANIESLHGDFDGFSTLFGTMQDAMMLGDPSSLAASVAYPITIEAGGQSYDIADEAEMTENFDTVFSAKAQEAIRTQDLADLIVTSEGVGFGSGEVWVSNVCRDDACAQTYWAITAINN